MTCLGKVLRGRRGWSILAFLALAVTGRADTVLTDFNTAPPGSYNPRANWSAFGAGTTDRGVQADGSLGNGAYHTVDWGSATWGVGDVSTVVVDLSAYGSVAVDARSVDVGGLTGTALLNFALDLPGGTEYSTPGVSLSPTYQTYVFPFTSLARTAGNGPLDLTAGIPKLIVKRNGQSGQGRFDFDQITALGSGFSLTPVVLNPPWDGDNVRGMWLYATSSNPRVNSAATAQAILDFCAREGVNRVYFDAFTIWTGSSGMLKANLRTFLTTAHESGIRVEAVIGDPNWPTDPNMVQQRVGEILAFHNTTPGDTLDDFDAVHFDVEFWSTMAWRNGSDMDHQQTARNYLDNVLVNTRTFLDANGSSVTQIATDLSTHFDTADMLPSPFIYQGVTQYFVEHVLDHANDVVFMSYYDTAGALFNVTSFELDRAAGKNRRVQLGADIQPVPPELPVNTFADNGPTPYSAMTTVLRAFHVGLTPTRLAALDGFSVFNYDGYSGNTPNPLSQADLDGDGNVDFPDFAIFRTFWAGPNVPAQSVARDGDYDRSGAVDLLDFAQFQACFTGPGGGSVPTTCER